MENRLRKDDAEMTEWRQTVQKDIEEQGEATRNTEDRVASAQEDSEFQTKQVRVWTNTGSLNNELEMG